MPRPEGHGRNSRRARSAGTSPSDQIPLNILRQSFVQNSSAESSHLSSSHSASTTPPSSAERLPPQATWPSPVNGDPYLSTATPPQLSQPPPTAEACAETAESHPDPQSSSPGHHDNQATPVSREQHRGFMTDAQGSPWVRLGRWVSKRGWFQSILGITSLVMIMTSLFVYGLRFYEMARWSERNDLLQMCAGLIQANVTGGPNCETVLREGPTLPPYSERVVMYAPGVGAYKMTRRAIISMQHMSHVDVGILRFQRTQQLDISADMTPIRVPAHTVTDYGFSGIGNWALAALSALSALAMAGGVLALLRSRSPDEVVFTSAARSEGSFKLTRHYPEGPETIEPEGPMQITRRHPPEDQSPGEIRRRVIQDRYLEEGDILGNDGGLPTEPSLNNHSEDTLMAAWTESNSRKVSIATGSDEGLHEGLIELKPTKNTKNFLDPDTGISYHISPWKSTHDGGDDDELALKSKSKPDGMVKRAIVGMSVGGAALGNGKPIEDKIAMTLQKKERVPQQAGDCLAGEVTNEPPTGKLTLA